MTRIRKRGPVDPRPHRSQSLHQRARGQIAEALEAERAAGYDRSQYVDRFFPEGRPACHVCRQRPVYLGGKCGECFAVEGAEERARQYGKTLRPIEADAIRTGAREAEEAERARTIPPFGGYADWLDDRLGE